MTDSKTIKDLIAYQDGAVVSKEIIRKPSGTVTLFAFGSDEGLSEHTTPYDALVVGIEGRAEITLAGEHHAVAEGQLLIMPANTPHAVKALTPFKMLLTMMRS